MAQYSKHQLAADLHRFYAKPVARVSLELFLSIGLVLGLAIFAIKPTLETMTGLLTEIEEKEALNEQFKKKSAALASAQIEYNSLEDRLTVLEEAIPSQPQLVITAKILEKLATENQVVIRSMNLPEIPPKEKSNSLVPKRASLPITVAVVGDYISIRNFANSLIGSRRSLIIDTITFSVQENRGDKKLTASITINAPYYGESL